MVKLDMKSRLSLIFPYFSTLDQETLEGVQINP
jgi:hypothetical protein